MELAAKYAYEVYEKGSFSLAAKELYVSQPALSTMIARLERELGFQIFQRTRGGILNVTPKGRIYLDMIAEQRASEETMRIRLEQLDKHPSEVLRIGAIMYPAQTLLSETFLRFNARFPNVHVYVNAGTVGPHGVLHDKLASGELDLLLSYRLDGNRFDALPLFHSRFLIAIHREHPGAARLLPYGLSRKEILKKSYTESQTVTDPSLFEDVEFISGNAKPSAALISFFGAYYNSTQISVLDSRNSSMQFYMMKAGVGAVVIRDINLIDPIFDDSLLYVVPRIKEPQSTLYLLWKKGRTLSDTEQSFAELLEDHFKELSE